MAAELSKGYSFCSDSAFDAAAAGSLAPRFVLDMMKTLDTVRDIAAGTATVLRMTTNADIMRASDGPEPQISVTDVAMLQTLCLAAQAMIEEKATDLMRAISQATDGAEAAQ